jgi:outer membrane protein with beta-barrel domain
VTRLRLTILLVPVLLELSPAALAAQSLEAGGSVATSCIGSDGSFCSENNLLTAGPSASIWFAKRVEVGARVVWFQLNDLSLTLTGPATIDLATTDRKSVIAQGEVIWHFRPDKRTRPLLGLGVGRYWRNQVATCDPPGCEAALGPGFTFGRTKESDFDASVVVGLSVLLNPRVRVRGGWRYHNPFRDELAVSELFIALGYRIGRL